MPQTASQPAARQSYDAHRGNNLLSEVTSVICLLGPRSLLSAGFGATGSVLIVRRVEAEEDNSLWNRDFFEQQAMAETLLGDPGLIKAVFFAGEHLMPVPEAMYEKEQAEAWTQQLWATGREERLLHCRSGNNVRLLAGVPGPVPALIESFFANAVLMPLASAHLHYPPAQEPTAQCTLTDDLATATLHAGGRLLWQGTFPCTTPEDAAYQLLSACAAHRVEPGSLRVLATADAPYQIGILQAMEPYLPGLQTASENIVTHDSDWAPVLTLLYQLYACAS